MEVDNEGIRGVVKSFILREFLEGEDPAALDAATELMSAGILDSLATLKLITFLEEEFDIEMRADEADERNFNSISDIATLVRSKL